MVSYVSSLRFYEYALGVLSIGVLIHGLLLYADSVAVFIMVFTGVLYMCSRLFGLSMRCDIGVLVIRFVIIWCLNTGVTQQLSMRTTSFRACLLIFLF